MIPTNPPPTFRNPDSWSEPFRDFVTQCLVKNPENRATATQLLQVRRPAYLILILPVLILIVLMLFGAFISIQWISRFLVRVCRLQHPFIKATKSSSILRALITDAMEIKLKKQEAEEREQDNEDDDNSVRTHTHTRPHTHTTCTYTHTQHAHTSISVIHSTPGQGLSVLRCSQSDQDDVCCSRPPG